MCSSAGVCFGAIRRICGRKRETETEESGERGRLGVDKRRSSQQAEGLIYCVLCVIMIIYEKVSNLLDSYSSDGYILR